MAGAVAALTLVVAGVGMLIVLELRDLRRALERIADSVERSE